MIKSQDLVGSEEPWPELPWTEWAPTIDTLHMWVQIVGKVRMALAAPLNHWWHVPPRRPWSLDRRVRRP
jgi:hypothetical protein